MAMRNARFRAQGKVNAFNPQKQSFGYRPCRLRTIAFQSRTKHSQTVATHKIKIPS